MEVKMIKKMMSLLDRVMQIAMRVMRPPEPRMAT